MGTRIKIMDLDVDIISVETLEETVVQFLSNEYLNVIHMISMDYIELYEKNELVRETLSEADLVLPGEKAILSLYHVDVLATGGMVVNYRSAQEICRPEILKEKSCYLVLRNKKEAKAVYRYFMSHCPYMHIAGIYVADGTVTEDELINDINTKLPDIVLLSMESTEGEAWLHYNKQKINAKLCIVLGSLMNMILGENIHVPRLYKMLRLDRFYTFLAAIPYSSERRGRIFQKKVDNYNSKKLLEKADVPEELSDEDKE